MDPIQRVSYESKYSPAQHVEDGPCPICPSKQRGDTAAKKYKHVRVSYKSNSPVQRSYHFALASCMQIQIRLGKAKNTRCRVISRQLTALRNDGHTQTGSHLKHPLEIVESRTRNHWGRQGLKSGTLQSHRSVPDTPATSRACLCCADTSCHSCKNPLRATCILPAFFPTPTAFIGVFKHAHLQPRCSLARSLTTHEMKVKTLAQLRPVLMRVKG